MSSLFLSQPTSILYVHAKHGAHDDFWLIPGDSTYFCFACGIEHLEDKSLLSVMKKKIIGHLLSVLVQNNKIWKILDGKQDVVDHVLNLLVSLLSPSKDEDFGKLITECVIVIIKKSRPDHAQAVLATLLSNSIFTSNKQQISLAGRIIESLPQVVSMLFSHQCRYLKDILKNIGFCYDLWHIVFLCLKHSTENEKSQLHGKFIKNVLIEIVNAVNKSPSTQTTVDLIQCICIISQSDCFQKTLYEHELSKFTPSNQSIIELMKKLLLSTDDIVQVNAIKCITAICNIQYQYKTSTSLCSFMLDKGVNEFLLELLSTSNVSVLTELFMTFQQFINSERFSSMGHLLLSFSTIISAVKRCYLQSQFDVFYHGFVLFRALLEKISPPELNNMSGPLLASIFALINDSFTAKNEKFQALSISSLALYLRTCSTVSNDVYKKSLTLLDDILTFVENSSITSFDNSNFEMPCDIFCIVSYLAVKLNSEKNAATKNNEVDNFVRSLFHLVDRFCIPISVLMFLPLKNTQFHKVFYAMLLDVLELDSEYGTHLARKLAESSFIQNIYEFKLIAKKSSLEMDECLTKILLHLFTALEKCNLLCEFKDELHMSLLSFTLPFSDWKYVIAPKVNTEQFVITDAKISVLALLTYSHLAGNCFTTLSTLQPYLQTLASSEIILESLPVLAKRFFIYLWCQLESVQIQVNVSIHRNIVAVCEKYIGEKHLFFPCMATVKWTMRNECTMNMKQTVVCYYLQSQVFQENKDHLLQSISQSVVDFLEIILNLLAGCIDHNVIDSSLVLFTQASKQLQSHQRTELVKCTRTLLLTKENQISSNNSAAIYKCLNLIQTCCYQETVNEEECKLLYRALKHSSESLSPTLQLQVLNFVSIMLQRSLFVGDIKVALIVLNKSMLLAELQEYTFSKQDISMLGDFMMLQLHSVSVIILAELIDSMDAFSISIKFQPLKIKKKLFFEGLLSTSTPLLQTSLLVFWESFFKVKCKSQLFDLTDEEGQICHVTAADVHLVYVALQNLAYHQNELVGELVLSCLYELRDKLNKSCDVFKHPWGRVLLDYSLERIHEHYNDVFAVRLFTFCLKTALKSAKEPDFLSAIDALFNLNLENCTRFYLLEVIQLMNVVSDKLDDVTSQEFLKLKLRQIDQHITKFQSTSQKFYPMEVFGVFVARTQNSVDLAGCFKSCKQFIEKRIEIIEGDMETAEE